MSIIQINDASYTLPINKKNGISVRYLLQKYHIDFDYPCQAHHTCGKCRLKVYGNVSPLAPEEAAELSDIEIKAHWRLACCCKLLGDAKIHLPNKQKISILSWNKHPNITLTEKGIGIACDVGTTTIAMQLYNLENGKVLSEKTEENQQFPYGADVISRISACKENHTQLLTATIRNQLVHMAEECIRCTHVTKIDAAVITGNTAMMHILAGINPYSLSVAPFFVPCYFGTFIDWKLLSAPVYIPRCIGPYLGADILCAILASGLLDKNQISLLADIGTNGEMALFDKQHIFCCSTATGPAFEGGGISKGMPARPGAIYSVEKKNDQLTYSCIGMSTPTGICGSGIIDALNVMLEDQFLESTGFIEKTFPIGKTSIEITQKDVRQIQLAKAAVCAGLLTLIEASNTQAAKIDRFFIAGGFGNFLNLHASANIGLFPASLTEKQNLIGNAALGGATMLLLNTNLREYSSNIAKEAIEIPLNKNAVFQEKYIDCMMFERF